MSSDQPSQDAPKATWREWGRSLDRSGSSHAVADVLAAWPPIHGVVASYLAMASEVDLAAVHDMPSTRIVVPRVESGNRLTLHDLNSSKLVSHRYGFSEPDTASTPVDLESVDVVLTPGLVFDRSGRRVGWGAGMYDRLLAELPTGVVRVGVGTDESFVASLPWDPHDESVDWVATESGVHRTGVEVQASTQAVIDRAIPLGIAPAIVRVAAGTKTSADAARAVGCDLGAIAKSLVFEVDDRPVLVLCSGDRRVDEGRLASVFGGGTARPASLDRVRAWTGFVAGGTPGVGHDTELEVVVDSSLSRYRWVWSAGGTPDTVYPVALERLVAANGARWADVSTWG